MPTTCSSCGVRLYGDEILEGTCENCRDGGSRTASAPPSQFRPEAEKGHGRDDRRRVSGGGRWRTFRTGLRCLSAALVVYLLSALIGLVLGPWARVSGSGDIQALNQVLQAVGGLVVLLLWVMGLCLLCAVPGDTELRPLAWGALSCHLLAFVGLVALAAANFVPAAPDTSAPPATTTGGTAGPVGAPSGLLIVGLPVCGLLGLVGYVCVCLLFSGAARQLGDSRLGRRFNAYLVLSVVVPLVLFVLLGVLLFSSMTSAGSGGASSSEEALAVLVMVGFLGIATLFFVLWLLTLLSRLGQLCTAPSRPPAPSDGP
jgi:hypothetical protein